MTEHKRTVTRTFALGAAGALCLAALSCVALMFGAGELRLFVTVVTLAGCSVMGFVGATRLGRNPRWLGPIGIGTAAVLLLLVEVLVWTGSDNDLLSRGVYVVLILSVALTHASLLLPRGADREAVGFVIYGSIAAIAALAALLIIPILFDLDVGSGYFRALGVVAVLVVLGSLLIPIGRRVTGGAGAPGRVAGPTVPPGSHPLAGDAGLVLGVTYLGRAFEIRAVRPDSLVQAFTAEVWEIERERTAPMPALSQHGESEEVHAALSEAVRRLTQALAPVGPVEPAPSVDSSAGEPLPIAVVRSALADAT